MIRTPTIDALTPRDLDSWDRLADRAVESNPFFESDFVRTAAAALGGDDVRLLIVEDETGWIGCMPVNRRRLAGVAGLGSTWKHPYSFLGTPLVDRDRVDAFALALVERIRTRVPRRVLLLRRCGEGPVLRAIRAAAAADSCAPVFEHLAERGAYRHRPPDEQLGWMKSRRRSELKRQRRRLSEELESEVVVRDRPDTEAAVDAFLALETSGWKGDEGTAMASEEGSAELFRKICGGFAATGRLRLRSLQAGERDLAMTCDIRAGDTVFGFKSAYDEDLSRFSPGVQLQAENFAHFDEEHDEALFDSCAEPGNESIQGLWPDRREITTVAFTRDGRVGRMLGNLLETAHDARQRRAGGGGE